MGVSKTDFGVTRDDRKASLYTIINKNGMEAVVSDFGAILVKLIVPNKDGEKADVVFMDPPRSGSSEKSLNSVIKLSPKKIVYISCNPETLARDLNFLTRKYYIVKDIQPVEMFCFTDHTEVVTWLEQK